jgi:hypothetical protein
MRAGLAVAGLNTKARRLEVHEEQLVARRNSAGSPLEFCFLMLISRVAQWNRAHLSVLRALRVFVFKYEVLPARVHFDYAALALHRDHSLL